MPVFKSRPGVYAMKIKPLFKWYDLWIGVFIDTKKRCIYVFPFPTIGVVIEL